MSTSTLPVGVFPKTLVNRVSQISIQLTNSGDATATNISMSIDGDVEIGFTGGAYPGTGGTCGSQILEGESCLLNVSFAPLLNLTFNSILKLKYEDTFARRETEIPLSGKAAFPAKLVYDLPTYDFQKVAYDTVNSLSGVGRINLTVTNIGEWEATDLNYVSPGAPYYLVGNNCAEPMFPGETCILNLEFRPSALAVFDYNATGGAPADTYGVSVNYNDGMVAPASTNQAALSTFKGTGAVPALLALTPTPHPFNMGQVIIGVSKPSTYTVTNSGEVPAVMDLLNTNTLTLPFSFLGSSYPGLTGTCVSVNLTGQSVVNPGEVCNIVVVFTPTVVGIRSETVELAYDNGVNAQLESQGVQAEGIDPAILVLSNTATYDFGVLHRNEPAYVTFTLTNIGGSPASLIIDTTLAAPFSYEGGFPGTDGVTPGTCTANLAPNGANCTVVAKILPTVYGTPTDDMQIDYFNALFSTITTKTLRATVLQPTVTLTAPLNGSYINIANQNSLTVTGACSENTRSVNLQLGSISTSVACTALAYSATINAGALPEGAVSLTADHMDAFGNTANTATVSLIKDSVAPTVLITSAPIINNSNKTSYTVSGTCSESGRTVSVSVGGLSASLACAALSWTTTLDVSGLADNPAVAITADHIDLAANPSLQATAFVLKDTVDPMVDITVSPVINNANKNSYTLSGTCSENTRVVSVNIGGVLASPLCSALSWTTGAIDVSAAADSGALIVTANHVDAAGNVVTDTTTVFKDTIDPLVTITSSPIINNANKAAYVVSGTCGENSRIVTVNVGGVIATPVCAALAWTASLNVTSIGDSLTVAVTANHVDIAGNPAIQATVSVVKDTVDPIVTITSAPVINNANKSAYTVAGTCTENGRIVSVNAGGVLATPTCSGTTWSTGPINMTSASDSLALAISANHTDVNGNVAPQANVTVVKDTFDPSVLITSSPSINNANKAAYTVSGSCTESGQPVLINVGAVSSTGTCTLLTWTTTVNVVSEADSLSVPITANHADASGNVSVQATATVVKDTIDPLVSITSAPTINNANKAAYVVSGLCSESTRVVSLSVGGVTASPVCTMNVWSQTLNVTSVGDSGAVLITANHTDFVGNNAPQATASVIKDTLDPQVTITSSPVINNANKNAYTVSGTCSEDTRAVNVNVGGVLVSPACSALTWTTGAIDVSLALDSPTLSIRADHNDAVGNMAPQAAVLVLKDTIDPSVAITSSPIISNVNKFAYTFSGTCSESTRIVSVSVGGITATPTCTALTWTQTLNVAGLSDNAAVLITADHVDAAGNPAVQHTTTVLKDTTIPTVTITPPPVINNANKASYTVSGTCSENSRIVSVDVGGVTSAPVCALLAWSTTMNVIAASDGSSVAITANHIDAVGNAALQAGATVVKDTTDPSVLITAAPVINNANKSAYTVSGSCSETGQAVLYNIGSLSGSVMCSLLTWTTTVDISGNGDSLALAITADHTDAAGNIAPQATRTVIKDTSDPTVSITSSPVINNANKAAYTVSGLCSENTRAVPVSVGGVLSAPVCSMNTWSTTVNVTSVGDNTAVLITANHTDAAGNSAPPASTSVIKDTLDPLVAITSSPVINNANKTAYTVSGTCSENTQTVSVSIGGVLASPVCTSNVWTTGAINVSLASDSPTLSITANHNDAVGNMALQAAVSVLKDTIDPSVLITSSPVINNTNKAAYTFSGTCSENTQTVSVNVGGVTGSATCTALVWTSTLNVVSVGDNSAVVITADHNDASGNSALQATASVVKDTFDPIVAITSSPVINNANRNAYTVSGTCSENTNTVSVSVGGVLAAPSCVGLAWSTGAINVSAALDSATLLITANHIDTAGNNAVQATASVVKDTINPDVAITSFPVINNANKNAYTVSGTCTDNGQPVVITVGSVSATGTCLVANWSTTVNITGDGDSLALPITANHTDAAGNIAPQATRTVIKDTFDPTVSITSSPVINNANKAAYTVSGLCSENTRAVSVSVGGVLSAPVCSMNTWSTTVNVTSVGDNAAVLITANHTDAAGNSAPPASTSVIKDTLDPLVAITSSPVINNANKTAYTVSGTCSENTRTVNVSIGGVLASPVCTSNVWTTGAINVSLASDSPTLSITANHNDAVGNMAVQAAVSVLKDTIDPSVLITSSPVINNANKAAYTFSGTCSENTQTVSVNVGGVTGSATCTALVWTSTLNVVSVGDNSAVAITADHNDASGNSALQATASVVKDTFDPIVAITSSPVINNANRNAYTVSGTCSESGRNVSITVGGLPATSVCTLSVWTTTLNVSTVTDALSVLVSANHTDTAGNNAIPATANVVKDTLDPTVLITSSPVINNANKAAYTVSGTCTENSQIVSVVVGGLSTAPICTSNAWTTTLNVTSLGDNLALAITADHTDVSGNLAPQATASVVKDTFNPTVSIVSAPAINNANKASYTVSGNCSETTRTVGVRIGSVLVTPSCVGTTWSTGPVNVSSNGDSIALLITADHTDAAGNVSVQAQTNVVKDTFDPTVAITAPAVINNANKLAYTVSGSCSETGQTVLINVGSVSTTDTCTLLTWTATVNISGDGDSVNLLIRANHNDASGNLSPQATATVLKDTQNPLVAITSSPVINTANAAAYTVSGTCSENTRTVAVSVGGVTASPACTSLAWSATLNVAGVSDSLVLPISADHTDAAGNVAPQDSTTVIKDTDVPLVAFTVSPVINNANRTSYTASGTCSENTRVVSVSIGGVLATSTCAGFTWTTGAINVSAASDSPALVLTANHIDSAGNSAVQAVVNVVKDTFDPLVTIGSSPVINNANKAAYTVSGTCSENTRTVSVNVGGVSASPSCSALAWTATINVSTVGDSGAVLITANHTDQSGNSAAQATASVLKDTFNPMVAVTSAPAISTANQAAYTISGTCSENGNIVSVNVGGATAGPACVSNVWSATMNATGVLDSSAVPVTATHLDVALNSTTASTTVIKVTALPTVLITSSPTINNSNKTAYTVSGTCSANTEPVNVSVGGILSSPICTSSVWSTTINALGLGDTTNLPITANHSDVYGNNAVQATASVIKDTNNPTVVILSSPVINNANKSSYTVSGSCSESGRTVSVFVGTVSGNDTCTLLAWSVTVNASGNADSTALVVTADHTDAAGNNAVQAGALVVKDTFNPNVAISTPGVINNANKAAYTVSGTCSENSQAVSVNVGGVTSFPTCTTNLWTATLNVTGVGDSSTVAITANHVDAAGNPAAQATASAVKDTVDPLVAFTSTPVINNANKAAYTVSGTCSENTRTVSVNVGGVLASPACTTNLWSTTVNVSLVSDSSTVALTANHTDVNGNSASQASASVIKDTSNPNVAITPPAVINNANKTAYTVSGTCSESGQSVQITVGAISVTGPCTLLNWSTTVNVSGISDSLNLPITANHIDAAGNAATQALATTIKDTLNPLVAVTSSPVINNANKTTYTVSGTCSENTRAVNVSVGGITAAPICTSNLWSETLNVVTVSDSGNVAVTADLNDSNGNVAAQATASVIKDTFDPLVAITAAPVINNANKAAYTFSGTCSENTRAVSVSAGGVTGSVTCAATAWSATLNVTGVSDGLAIVLTADHTDAAGNLSLQATTSVIKDTGVPTVLIGSAPVINNANKAAYTVSGTCSENSQIVSVSVGGVTATPTCTTNAWTSTVDVTLVGDNSAVSVTANHIDAAGNPAVQASTTVIKDTLNPIVTISSAPVINNANKAAYTVNGTCTENSRTVSVNVGGVLSSPACTALAWTATLNVVGVGDSGTVVISADHTDAQGNVAVQATTSVVKDTLDPNVAITSSPVINNANKAAYTVSGTCSENTRAVSVNVGGVASSPICTAPSWTTTVNVSTVGDNSALLITANHTDAAGNIAAQASITVVKDTSNPTVLITSSPVINNANKTGYIVSGTCSENTRTVSVNVGGVTATPNCTALNWTTTLNVIGVGDSAGVSITADHTDAAGNTSAQATASVIKDTIDPLVAITSSPVINNANKAAYTVGGTCSENTRAVNVSVGSVSGAGTCTANNWTATLNVTTVGDGLAVVVTANHSDAAGNLAAQATNNVIKDTGVPTVAITPPSVINNANKAAYTVNGTCSENSQSVSVSVGGVTASPICTFLAWTTTVDVSGVADSLTFPITANHIDAAGNPSLQASTTVVKDTFDPVVTISSAPVINNANKAVYTVSGTCTENSRVVSVNVGSVSGSGTCTASAWTTTLNVISVSDGLAVSVTGNHTDASGNSAAQATTTTIKDTINPIVAITSSPVINNANKSSYTVSGTCDQNTRTVSVTVGGVSGAGTCTAAAWSATLNVTGVSDSTTLQITADHTDAAGNNATQATTSVIKDTSDPLVAVTSNTIINNANRASYTVSGTCSENTRSVSVSIGGVAATATCTAPTWTTGAVNVSTALDSAALTITADHTDAQGNSAVQATASVLKDTFDPSVAITSSPIISNANVAAYTVSGTCSENTRTVSVSVGGVTATPACSTLAWSATMNVTSVGDNAAVLITANHTDAAGNNAPQNTTTVLKDTGNPNVAITSAPLINNGNKFAYTVSGTCSENTRVVSVSVGGVTSAPVCTTLSWTTTLNVSGLADSGSVPVTANHLDAVGNAATQAATTVIKNTTAPSVAINPPSVINNANKAAYSVSGTCSDSGQPVTIAVGSVTATETCLLLTWSTTVNVTLQGDSLALLITADHVNNVGNPAPQASVTTVKDTSNPNVAITSSPVINNANKAAYTVSGTCSENARPVSVSVGGVTSTPTCTTLAWSATVNVTGVGDSLTVAVTANHSDSAGNPASQASTTVIKDTLNPSVTIASSPVINSANQAAYIVSGGCSENTQSVSVNVGGVTSTPTCTALAWTATLNVVGVSDNSAVLITANHVDANGNSAPQASVSVIKDTSNPTVMITSSPVINNANKAAYTISGTCSENTRSVTASVGGVSGAGTCTALAWSATFNVTGVSDNLAVAVTADHTDSNGNVAVQATTTVLKDTGIPSVTISSPTVINAANQAAYTVTGTCSENTQSVTVNVGGVASTPTCTALAWTANLNVTGVSDSGSVLITANHSDAVGNPAVQGSTNVVKDTVAPIVTISSSPVINNANKTAYTIGGTCTENTRAVSVSVGGVSGSGTCTAFVWSATLNVNGVGDGLTVAVTANHTDASGNPATQTATTVIKDTGNPNVAITSSPVINNANIGAYVVSGTCSENAQAVSVNVGGVSSTPTCSTNAWTATLNVTGVGDSSAVLITANHIDAAGNPAAQASTSVIKDTSNPTVTITSFPVINNANKNSYTVSGACSENTQLVSVSVGGSVNSTPTCTALAWTTNVNVSGLGDGNAVSITADHIDVNGNPATQATRAVIKDTLNPMVAITSSPVINNANKAAYTVSGTCSENTRSVSVSVGGQTSTATCTTPNWTTTFNVSGASDSPTLLITADHTDAAGNNSTQATASVVKDTSNPNVAITAPPAINNANKAAYTVSGTCTENTQIVNVNIGGVLASGTCTALAWTTGPVNVIGATDSLTLAITANHSDAAGNPATQATASVVKDTLNPNVFITSSPVINNANKASYTVSGTCTENTRIVSVNIGGVSASGTCSASAWTTGSVNVSTASDGPTLLITADHTDAVGNTATQATASVVKDTNNPLVAILSSPAINNTNKAAYTVSGTCSESGQTVLVNVGGVSGTVACTLSNWSETLNVTGVTDSLTVSVTANHTDSAGNPATQATASVVKDTVDPTVAITSSPVINNANKAAYTVSGTCSENTRTVSVNIGGVLASGTCTAPTWTTGAVNVGTASDSLTLSITANHADSSGNPAVQASASVVKDTVDPIVAIMSSPVINNANRAAYTVSGTCDQNTRIVNVNVGGVTSAPTCTTGAWTTTFNVTGATDSLTLPITANHTDAAGNSATQATASVVKDTSDPLVTITTPSVINNANVSGYTVSGTCSENTRTVTVNIGGVLASGTCTGLGWTTGSVNVAGAGDSLTLSITANHTDVNGNSAVPATASTVKDTSNPSVLITSSPAINNANNAAYTVSGTCSENSRIVTVNVGGVTSTPSCSALAWTTSLNVNGVGDNSAVAITANHVDAAGNPAVQATASVVKDTSSPTVTITSAPVINTANMAAYAVSGACSENSIVVNVNVGGVTSAPACTALAWTTTLNVSGVGDSLTVPVTANHNDAVGNSAVQATASVIKDTSIPTVTISPSAVINTANVGAYTVTGSCSENSRTVTVSIGGVAASATCSGLSWSTGPVNVGAASDSPTLSITANHTDSNGNPATQATASVVKDTNIPTVTITSSPVINNANIAFYTVSGACSENSRTVNVSVGGVTSAPACTALAWTTSLNVTGVSDSNSVSITANHTDAAGNSAAQATASVIKDTSNPTVTITSSPVINIANAGTYTVSGACSENSRIVNVNVGGVTSAPTCSALAWSATLNVAGVGDSNSVSITANHTDVNGNSGATSTTVVKDTVIPSVAINPPAVINNANKASYPVSGTCSETGQSVTVSVGVISGTTSCSLLTWSTSLNVSTVGDGVAVSVRADHVDAAGNPAVQAATSTVKDTSDPLVAITSSPVINNGNAAAYPVSGTCSENGRTVVVVVGGVSGSNTCATNLWSVSLNVIGVADSSSVAITANHTDSAGNTAVQATATVIKDTSNPLVTIGSAPVINNANAGAYIVSGTCSENSRIVSVSVGGVSSSPTCTTNLWSATLNVIGVGDGSVTVTANHTDVNGNSAATATTSVTKDTSNPTVTITSAPVINNANLTTYTVSGACSENTRTVSVNVGGVTSSPTCTTLAWSATVNATTVGDGSVTVTANHTDVNGNIALTASTTVVKDTSNPTVTISPSPTINNANRTAYTVSGTCSENTRTVSVSIGGVLASVTCSALSWTTGAINVTGATDSPTLSITANHTDVNGNTAVTATASVIKDTSDPTVLISIAPVINNSNIASYTVTGTCSENTRIVTVNVGGVSSTPTCTGLAWSATLNVTSVGDGPAIAITANHTDANGNTAAPASASVVKDTSNPTVAIGSAPTINTSNQAAYTISGGCSENTMIVTVSVGGVISTPTCTALAWTTTYNVTGAAESSSLAVTANHTDANGNPATPASITVIKDTVIPTVTIGSAPTINNANRAAYTVSGACSENTRIVTVSVGGVTSTPTCSGLAWTTTYDVSSAGDSNTLAVTAIHTDAAGNTSTTASTTVVKDTSNPTVTISSSTAINNANKGSYTVNGTCSENSRIVSVNVGGVPATPICTALAWTTTVNATGVGDNAAVSITASHTDVNGNTETASTTVLKDTGIPTVTITSSSTINKVNKTAYPVSGACSENTRFVTVTVGGLSGTATCTSLSYTVTIDVNTLADGPSIAITANHTDLAGNPAAQANTTVVKNTADQQPAGANFTAAAFNEDTQSIISLPNTDPDIGDFATSCAATPTSINVSVTQACTCNGAGACSVGVTGALNFNGAAAFTYTVSSFGNTSIARTATLSITPVNDAPVLGAVATQTTPKNTPKAVPFTLNDVESTLTCSATHLSMTSSDTTIVANGAVAWSGTYPNCSATISPLNATVIGTTNITITATDGSATSTRVFALTVQGVVLVIRDTAGVDLNLLQWANMPTGQGETATFRVYNTGNITSAAVIIALTAGNTTNFDNPIPTSDCATGVAALGFCTVTVTFSNAGANGIKSATMTTTANGMSDSLTLRAEK